MNRLRNLLTRDEKVFATLAIMLWVGALVVSGVWP